MKTTLWILILSGIAIFPVISANAIIIRHDVNEQRYVDLGNQYSASVAYAGGCAVTVLSDYWLLTAAHCISGREENFFTVEHLAKDYRIEKMVLHPKFDKSNDELFDVALIQLKEPISNSIPVKLYKNNDEEGKRVVFVGKGVFGNGSQGLIRSDSIQRGATNKVFSVSDQVIGFKFHEPENATELEGISSRGDSGGPAFIQVGSTLYIVGISSYQERNGLKEGTYGVYEYYSRVSLYVDWLNSVMEKTKNPSLPQHPIIEAIKNNDIGKLKLQLSKNINLKSKTDILNEAIYQSVQLDRIILAQELLKHGVEVKNISINNTSLFEFSLIKGRKEYFDMLLKHTADQKDIHKLSSFVLPLAIAVFNEDINLLQRVKVIVNQNVDINATLGGDTALLVAGWNTNNIELIKYLVEKGADINIANNDGNTALMDAAALGKVDLLNFLLSNDARIDIKNKNGKTALDFAREKNHEVIVSLLMAKMRLSDG